ncbi:extracellular solute-binding protein [Acuticoccus kandeliae]|uniref:extracellular solute-binding protein n=1 Tax=Acuticoccus kandeliae TaxID=2073160 RepID=UPI00196AC85A|nr:extracellular solute-binding protein [Acuticoccus kandeliae]
MSNTVALGAVAGSTLAMPHIARAQASSITVSCYGGAYEKFFREVLIPTFTEQTGATVNLALGTAKDFVPLMRAAGQDNPPLDVLMTNEVICQILRSEDFFEPIPLDKVPNMADVAAIARYPDDMAVTGILQPIGITYRTDMLPNPPQSWDELFKREDLLGQTGIYAITNSCGFMFVLLMARHFGGSEENIDAAFAEIEKLKPFNQVDFSGTMEGLLAQGEVIVAPLDFAAVMRLQSRGMPIDGIVPPEGLIAFDQVFNVSKGGQKKELAYAWVDYMLSPATQSKIVSGFYSSPTNTKAEIPADLASNPLLLTGDKLNAVVRHDWAAANANRSDIVDQWNRTMS